MPRNISGVYSKAANTAASPNTTITSTQFNNTIDDIVTDLNAARPVTAGGTGADNAADARTNLQVARAQESAADAEAGRGLVVGAFGLGGNAAIAASDWDGINRSGYYRPTDGGSATGAPTTSSSLAMHHLQMTSSGRAVQTAWRTAGGGTPMSWYRWRDTTAWSAWQIIYHSGNVLGTVSQVAGEPTGAIINSGSDPVNGRWVQWADGTLIQRWGGYQRTTDTAVGAIFRSSTEVWTYPCPTPFAAIPVIVHGAERSDDPVAAPWGAPSAVNDAVTVTQAQGMLYGPTNTARGRIMWLAVGRWY